MQEEVHTESGRGSTLRGLDLGPAECGMVACASVVSSSLSHSRMSRLNSSESSGSIAVSLLFHCAVGRVTEFQIDAICCC